MLRLRQLLHVPATAELTLPTDIVAAPADRPGAPSIESASRESASSRTAVREAAESVARGEQLVLASEAGRLPAVSLTPPTSASPTRFGGTRRGRSHARTGRSVLASIYQS
jgi:outer membrane protein TolC